MSDGLRWIFWKFLKIGDWMLIPYESKNYAQCIVKKFRCLILPSLESNKYVVELGCGAGDIIGNLEGLKRSERIGYDIQPKRVWLARLLYPQCKFMVGDYQKIHGQRIGCLIIVNLLHFLEPSYVDNMMKTLICSNDICFIVCDTIINSELSSYSYEVDLREYLGFFYERIYQSRRLHAANGAWRYVEIYRKVNNS